MAQPRRRTTRRYAIRIPFLNQSIALPNNFSIKTLIHVLIDYGLYLLGPILIVVALGIIYAMVHTFYTILLPLRTLGIYDSPQAIAHQIVVFVLVFQILFNYHACVRTSNSSGTKAYEGVVRALAHKTGFEYPETMEERHHWGNHWKDLMMTRSRVMRERALARQVMEDATGAIQLATAQYKEQTQMEKQKHHPLKQTVPDGGMSNIDIDVEVGGVATSTTDGIATKQRRTPRDTTSTRNNQDMNKKTGTSTRRRTAPTATSTPQRAWMMIGPHEWSHCRKTQLPKPPRSHYDHVTKTLVLNMDHYCPWMFNVVGYFNYRYFVNFLLYVSVGMIYGVLLSWNSFRSFDTPMYFGQIAASRELFQNATMSLMSNQNQTVTTTTTTSMDATAAKFHLYQVQHLYPHIPTPTERTPIAFCFMICLAVGIAVTGLLLFHLYLISTAQTTIEFHANGIMQRHYDGPGSWKNPYHLGWRRNWEQIWGRPSRPFRDWGGFGWWMGMMVRMGPSWRLPDFLPVPLKDDVGDWNTTKSLKKNANKNAVGGHRISTSTHSAGDDVV